MIWPPAQNYFRQQMGIRAVTKFKDDCSVRHEALYTVV